MLLGIELFFLNLLAEKSGQRTLQYFFLVVNCSKVYGYCQCHSSLETYNFIIEQTLISESLSQCIAITPFFFSHYSLVLKVTFQRKKKGSIRLVGEHLLQLTGHIEAVFLSLCAPQKRIRMVLRFSTARQNKFGNPSWP